VNMNWWRRRDLAVSASAEELFAERLSAYLDQEDTPAERAALESELASDAPAREALEGLQRVQATLAALGPVRAPRSFALVAPPSPARAGLPSFAWVTRAGAAVSALMLAVVLTQGSASETPVTALPSAKQAAPVTAESQVPAGAADALTAPADTPGPPADSTPSMPAAAPPAPPPVASPELGALAPAPAAAPAAAPASEPTSTPPVPSTFAAPAADPSAAATPTPGAGERSVAPAIAPPLPVGTPEPARSPAGARPVPVVLPDEGGGIGGGIEGGTTSGERASYQWNGAAAGLAVATVLLGLLALLPLGSRRGGR